MKRCDDHTQGCGLKDPTPLVLQDTFGISRSAPGHVNACLVIGRFLNDLPRCYPQLGARHGQLIGVIVCEESNATQYMIPHKSS